MKGNTLAKFKDGRQQEIELILKRFRWDMDILIPTPIGRIGGFVGMETYNRRTGLNIGTRYPNGVYSLGIDNSLNGIFSIGYAQMLWGVKAQLGYKFFHIYFKWEKYFQSKKNHTTELSIKDERGGWADNSFANHTFTTYLPEDYNNVGNNYVSFAGTRDVVEPFFKGSTFTIGLLIGINNFCFE